jgi:phosphoribosylanthranilate isomerase
MRLFVKICGICSESDFEQILALGPDALGFVFWPGSPRYIAPDRVRIWQAGPVCKTGVFVEPSVDELLRAVETAGLKAVQLHRRNPDWVPDLPSDFPVPVWAACRPEAANPAGSFFKGVARVVLDAFDPVKIGGTGRTCDWVRAAETVHRFDPLPVLLAGGLTPENVAEAVRTVRPAGVDVSSGIETEPGRKNITAVREFIRICREVPHDS